MADVQKENGYTPIANEIMDKIVLLPLNGTQWRIITVVWRYTYGFSRKTHNISVGFILKALSLNNSQYKQISRELGNLFKMGVLIENEKPDKNKTRQISFNKDYDLWTKKSSGQIRPVDGLDQREWTKKSIEPLDGLVHQDKQIYKTNIKTIYIDDFFEAIWGMYPRKEGKGSVSMAQKKKLYAVGQDEMIRAIERYKAKLTFEKTERKYTQKGSTFFNSGYVDYLDKNYSDVQRTSGKPNYADADRYKNQSW